MMITYLDAQFQINSFAHSFGTETVDLDDAFGRILAMPIIADRDYPPFNRCTMDGYAIRLEDFELGIREFEIIEIIYAGQESKLDLSQAQCYKIMTGSAVPLSANAVIPREDTNEKNQQVLLNISNCNIFQNIAQQGQDIKAGSNILNPPHICSATVISLLASLGQQGVRVEKLPNVALFTTGNEVMPVNFQVSKVQIRNSNRHLLKALLLQQGIKPILCDHIPDDKEQLVQAFKKALTCDIIVISGGVSAGDTDFVPEVLESLGVKKLFHKVAIKPGKPIWCGQMPNKGMVFALPGNPFSCMVTFKLFIESFLQASFGMSLPATLQLPFNDTRSKKSNLDEFFPVRINEDQTMLESVAINGSGDIRLGLHANALAHHPAKIPDLTYGMAVNYYKL